MANNLTRLDSVKLLANDAKYSTLNFTKRHVAGTRQNCWH